MKRRAFLGLGAAALASSSAFAVPVNRPQKFDESYDVVIIGAGGAGLAAATEAVKNKLSAIVIEKEAAIGGSSVICGGQWAVGGTDEQTKRGIKDSDELFVKDMMATGQNQNDLEVVKAYVKET